MTVSLKQTDLHFLPLGGCGEIGMNLNLYYCQGKWLMVDLGVTFEDVAGMDVVMPDLRGFLPYAKDLVGLVLTHAHEDHIGAVAYLWHQLRCPLYATPFTASLLNRKLKEWGTNAIVHEIPLGGQVSLGPFEVTFISLTHSIPEPNALAIRTPLGTILHTGDWKIDPHPLIGDKTDQNALEKLGDEGVVALVCDSTSVFEAGHSGSELDVKNSLVELTRQFSGVRVVMACFASNVARLSTCAHIAQMQGRKVVLAGRSLERMDQAARQAGYFDAIPPFIGEREMGKIPRGETLLVCTGSQGESRAALSRIARKEHPRIRLEEGDVVIFSSRIIPGNDKSIYALQNQLARQGIQVITHKQADSIHVSGHPSRDELTQMYSWIRPRVAIPVHGEDRHLIAHGQLAKDLGVPYSCVPRNGQIISFSANHATVVGDVPVGRLGLDGRKLIPLNGLVVQDRCRLGGSGFVQVGIVLSFSGKLKDLQISLWGVCEESEMDELLEGVESVLTRELSQLSAAQRQQDNPTAEALRLGARRFIYSQRGKKPVVHVQIFRL